MTTLLPVPVDPMFDMSRWPWPYGPFAMTDQDGNCWKLSAEDPWRSGKTARLICETTAEIDGVKYKIVGCQPLHGDGTPIVPAERTQISPPPAAATNPRRVMRRSLAVVRKAMTSPEAPAAFRRAVAVAQLPFPERLKVMEQTNLAFASKESVERQIAWLKEEVRPHGGEDQATAKLIAELASIRVNGSRKRREVERLAESLHNRTGYRAAKKERLRRYEARLAQLQRLERETANPTG